MAQKPSAHHPENTTFLVSAKAGGPDKEARALDKGMGKGPTDTADDVDLSGFTVLVVEDDFCLATDIERALRGAKAEVLGPVGQEHQALSLIATETPSCAFVDINLGIGAQFAVADALKARDVPFMFTTAYDDVMIPDRFNDIGRVRKPSGCRLLVKAAKQMCRPVSQRAEEPSP